MGHLWPDTVVAGGELMRVDGAASSLARWSRDACSARNAAASSLLGRIALRGFESVDLVSVHAAIPRAMIRRPIVALMRVRLVIGSDHFATVMTAPVVPRASVQ
jgi:hypothetical protein